MSTKIQNIENLNSHNATIALIEWSSEVFTSIEPQDIPKILQNVLENIKSLGSTIIKKVTDFMTHDLWGLVINIKDILKYLSIGQFYKMTVVAREALAHLEKVLDILSYIPCLCLATSILLSIIYLANKDYVNVAIALLGILGVFKVLRFIFPKSTKVLNALFDGIKKFADRFKGIKPASLRSLAQKASSPISKVQSNLKSVPQTINRPNVASMQTTAMPQIKFTELTRKKVSATKEIKEIKDNGNSNSTIKEQTESTSLNNISPQVINKNSMTNRETIQNYRKIASAAALKATVQRNKLQSLKSDKAIIKGHGSYGQKIEPYITGFGSSSKPLINNKIDGWDKAREELL